jgi:hypothetical protein
MAKDGLKDDGVTDGFGFRPGEDAMGFTEEEREQWRKARLHEQFDAVIEIRNARRQREQRERERQAWPATRPGQLLKKLGDCFAEYRECLAQDPRLQEKALEFDEVNQKIFNKMKTTMEQAHNAPRCRYPKGKGLTCKAPRVRGKKYCHMHLMLEEARPEKIRLPNLGDANGIHGAIAKGAQAVVDGKLDYKQASILGYYLQLAVSNIGRVDFEEQEVLAADTR